MFVDNFTAEEIISVEMANNVCRFLAHFEELFFFRYLTVFAMTLEIFLSKKNFEQVKI